MQKDIDPSTAGGQFDGKTFTFTIPSDTELLRSFNYHSESCPTDADDVETGACQIYVSIPAGIPSLDPADFAPVRVPIRRCTIPLRTVAAAQDRDTPAVVSIQRLRPGSQTVVAAFQEAAVTGPFTVRIVLSEQPDAPADFHDK